MSCFFMFISSKNYNKNTISQYDIIPLTASRRDRSKHYFMGYK